MLIYIRVILTVKAPFNITGIEDFYNQNYCIAHDAEKNRVSTFQGIMTIRDLLCVLLMIWTSVYMVKFLFNHRKNVRHILRNSLCPQSSLEIKVTHTILVHLYGVWTTKGSSPSSSLKSSRNTKGILEPQSLYQMNKEAIDTVVLQETAWGVLFFFQFMIGFVGNLLLLMLYVKRFLQRKKPIDWIFTHLTLANMMTVIFAGTPELIFFFGIRIFLNDTGCQAVLFLYRVGRGLSLCTTSFLSVFQAIVITNNHAQWAWFKSNIYTCISSAFLFFWALNMLIYIRVILLLKAPFNVTGIEEVYNKKYCMGHDTKKMKTAAFVGGMILRDFLCVFLMVWTSVHLVNFLFNHRKNVRHILRHSLCPQSSLEIKATHTILAQVSCFVFFYWTNCCLTIYLTFRHEVQGLRNITVFVSSCYPVICPFLLIKNHKGPFLSCTYIKKRKFSPQTTAVRDLSYSHTTCDTKCSGQKNPTAEVK
ncbi:LOW QUALITY PROTEIN: vomeronasal type-1 receptor 4-like [Sorex araneus]|uniref:LOW QUALITY PROTEIN: vomeronasal type-1 receptor 4-like n=1 Tax=Sorex araneus TaxID=42254 RepID=UPI0024339A0E|nr:LOW QUALITY PROTEIN: vomeronasal type-1 receptor 4-like [Sorex araneus]